jgi:transcription antitermination factor NusG
MKTIFDEGAKVINETVIKHKFQIGEKVEVISGMYEGEEGKVLYISVGWGIDNRKGYTHVEYTVNINGSPFLSCQERELKKCGIS